MTEASESKTKSIKRTIIGGGIGTAAPTFRFGSLCAAEENRRRNKRLPTLPIESRLALGTKKRRVMPSVFPSPFRIQTVSSANATSGSAEILLSASLLDSFLSSRSSASMPMLFANPLREGVICIL